MSVLSVGRAAPQHRVAGLEAAAVVDAHEQDVLRVSPGSEDGDSDAPTSMRGRALAWL